MPLIKENCRNSVSREEKHVRNNANIKSRNAKLMKSIQLIIGIEILYPVQNDFSNSPSNPVQNQPPSIQ